MVKVRETIILRIMFFISIGHNIYYGDVPFIQNDIAITTATKGSVDANDRNNLRGQFRFVMKCCCPYICNKIGRCLYKYRNYYK